MARKPHKYAAVCKTLPKLPGVEPERKDIVQAVKDAIVAPPQANEPGSSLDDMTEGELIDAAHEAIQRLIVLHTRASAGKAYAIQYAQQYALLRKHIDEVKSLLSSMNLLMEAYQWLMVESLEVEGVESIRLANGQLVSTFPEPYTQIVDPEANRLWCIAQGLENKMTLPWGTLNGLAKRMLIDGLEPPAGTKLWTKINVRLGSED